MDDRIPFACESDDLALTMVSLKLVSVTPIRKFIDCTLQTGGIIVVGDYLGEFLVICKIQCTMVSNSGSDSLKKMRKNRLILGPLLMSLPENVIRMIPL